MERILRHYLPLVTWVVFLGDYFDDFREDLARTLRTVHWLRESLKDQRFTFLLGNHDLQYLWPKCSWFRCTYKHPTARMIQTQFPLNELWKLQDPRGRIVIERYGWLLSHAGLHPYHVPPAGWSKEWMQRQEEHAYRNMGQSGAPKHHWLWSEGPDVGGRAVQSGPIWLRWENFIDDPRLPPQIVGHTARMDVRRKKRSLCIDTASQHVALLDSTGAVEIQATSGLG